MSRIAFFARKATASQSAVSAAPGRNRQEAFTAVASIRSLVSGSVVCASLGNPQNSDPVVFSSVRSLIPDTTEIPAVASCTTVVVRTSAPDRANEYPVAPLSGQPNSSTEIRARVIASCEATKNAASASAKSSGGTAPISSASANTRFFCESVGSTLELSPVRCESSRSPDRAVDTFQSRITSPPSGATPPPRPPALRSGLLPIWTMVTPPADRGGRGGWGGRGGSKGRGESKEPG